MKIYLVLFLFILSLLTIVLARYLAPPNRSRLEQLSNNTPSLVLPSPTPVPFAELTIPALRLRNYNSSLEERRLYSRQEQYTAYLTSYRSEGLRINGLLTIPTTEKPPQGFPAIVFVHGYIPPAQYSTTTNYAAFVDGFARNGFVVFKIDLRGHGQSEGQASGAYYSSDYVVDTLSAYSAVTNIAEVNPQAIGLWGHSMAGNIVSRSLAALPDIPAGVIWAGAVYTYEDFQEYGIQDSSFNPSQLQPDRLRRREELFSTHGQPSLTSEFWQQVAPVTYLRQYPGAIQLHHAIDDQVVSINFTRNLKQLLSASPVRLEVYEYPSGGHNLQGATFTLAMQRSIEFFRQRLSPSP